MGLNKRLIGAGAVGSGALTPSENFKVVLYTGNGGTQSITGVGFQPDFVWIKDRGADGYHAVHDSTRGATKGVFTNVNNAEYTGLVTSLDTDGFTVNHTKDGSDNNTTNRNGGDFVAWCWKAGGGTTSSNTDGDITSTVQANTDAGFSIVTWTSSSDSSDTIGHGLNSKPDVVLYKKYSSTGSWFWYTDLIDGSWDELVLNSFAAKSDFAGTYATSTTFKSVTSSAGANWITYCFHSVEGFSKFGTYIGNSSDNGPIVETGFEPAFLMIKNASDLGSWFMYDNKRNTSNPRKNYVLANASNVEASDMGGVDFLSNGFQIKEDHDDVNDTGDTYIYMAFAADPDTEAPTLADSFDIKAYTGTGAARSITGLGFKPGLVWTKDRGNAEQHQLHDIVRGATKAIASNLSNAEATRADGLTSFDSDGFSLGSDGAGIINDSSRGPYVAWNWKADDNEPTILPNTELSSLISKYKFEDNANDDYGDNNGTASNLSYVSGRFGDAADFNGSSSKILYPQAAPFNDSNTILSVSAWVKLDSASDEFVIMSASSTSDSADYMMLVVGGSKAGRIFMTDAPNNANEYQASFGSTNDTNWNHYVWQLSASGGIELWFNGTKQTRTQTFQAGSLNETKWFGDLTYATSVQYGTGINRVVTTGYSNGAIDQMRLFNAELTSSEISSLYNEANEAIVSANANAGFSIVKWTGDGVASTQIPHGLSAAPNMILSKDLSNSKTWQVYHLGAGSGAKFGGHLDSTAAFNTSAGTNGGWDTPTATTLKFSNGSSSINNLNQSGAEIIAYCFHDVAGYQKFGGYTGNGGNNRSITGLGFKPDFVMIKATSISSDWSLFDSRRSGNKTLVANSNPAEVTNDSNGYISSFDSDGFTTQVGSSDDVNVNNFNETYIYWAIAKNVPSNTTLAKSFGIATWTGNDNNNRAITGLGFRPDFVWIKRRNSSESHAIYDAVRGANEQLSSDSNGAEATNSASYMGLPSFDSDGFSVGNNGGTNRASNTYVGWAWKAGNTWQSNIDGSSASTVNVNTANGFSIVKYVGNQTAGHTIGHGLGAVPQVIILKCLDSTNPWYVYHVGVDASNPAHYNLRLNESDARQDSTTEFNDTAPTSTVFTLGTTTGTNKTDNEYIAYCWTPKSGFSNFGSYSGTGSSQTITTGFTPDFVITKKTNGTDNWRMYDSVRQNAQPFDEVLYPNLNDGEDDNTNGISGTTATGFTLGTGNLSNNSGDTYIYIAFKMN